MKTNKSNSNCCTLEDIKCPDLDFYREVFGDWNPCPGKTCPMHIDYKPVNEQEKVWLLQTYDMERQDDRNGKT